MNAYIISDIHVGEENKINDLTLDDIVTGILEEASPQDVVIAAGDLTHNGTASEYERVRAVFRRLVHAGIDVLAVPGNHDCGELGIFWDAQRRRHFDTFIARDVMGFTGNESWPLVVKKDDVTFVLLDSQAGNEGELLPPLARGELGRGQLERLNQILSTHDNVVLVLHHHPFWRDMFHAIEDNREFMSIVYNHNVPKGVVFGHKHKRQIYRNAGRLGLCIASGKSTHIYNDNAVRIWRWNMVTDDVDEMLI